MPAYYNENDPFAAQWLRNLIANGLIAPGDVDDRSIKDVQGSDLDGYEQCHFFAGIGGWSYALRLAGVPDDYPVWTGSCPCQDFSLAGKQAGFEGARDLWPAWFRLIKECRPDVLFGEQVDDSLEWYDRTADDLESFDYACGACVVPACAVGAMHERQRLFWMGDTAGDGYLREGRSKTLRANYYKQPRAFAQDFQEWHQGEAELVASGTLQRVSTYAEGMRQLDGIPGLMAKMRAYGNAIVPQVAAEFITAFMESPDAK